MTAKKNDKKKFRVRLANCHIYTIKADSFEDAGRIATKEAKKQKTCLSNITEVY